MSDEVRIPAEPMRLPVAPWLDEMFDTLDEIRRRNGMEVVGTSGPVLWGYKPGARALFVCCRGDSDFWPIAGEAAWAEISDMPYPRR